MKTQKQLEHQWRTHPAPPRTHGTVERIVARLGEGAHRVLDRGQLRVDEGLMTDRWIKGPHPSRDRQITVMESRVVDLLTDEHPPPQPGDNLIVNLELSTDAAPTGTRLRVGTCLLEVTDTPHTGCNKFRQRFGTDALAWVNAANHVALRLRGINCRVVESGEVAPGDSIVNLGLGSDAKA